MIVTNGGKWVLETKQKIFRIDRKEIAYLRFIFEACDGIALVRTIDAGMGIVALHIAPGCEVDVEMILKGLKKEIMMEDEHEISLY